MRSSSTCRRLARTIAIVITALAACAVPAAAQPSSSDRISSQYLRDSWAASQGFPGGAVSAIAQTPDGYLWIGTEKGLVRFDGAEFRLESGSAADVPITRVLGLLTDRDGTLWVRLQGARLVRYRDGQFENVINPTVQAEVGFTALGSDAEGRALLTGLRSGIVRPDGNGFVTIARTEPMTISVIIAIAEAADRTIWVGTRDAGLLLLRSGKLVQGPQGLPDRKINSLLPLGEREVWIATDSGIARFDGTLLTHPEIPEMPNGNQALAMMKDRGGEIWIGTGRGLMRLSADGRLTLDARNPTDGVPVNALFEDREGNLWVGTARGIERWRARTFLTYADGAVADSQGPIYADSRHRLWFAPASGGLAWLRGNDVGRLPGFDGDIVYSIAGDKSGLWVGRQRGGLTHLRDDGERFLQKTYGVADGLSQESVYAVFPARDGSIWAATLSGGVSRFKDARFTTFTTADGLAANSVSSIAEDDAGAVWFATPNGLSTYANGRWTTLGEQQGLPSSDVITVHADADGILWAGTASGLAYVSAGRVVVPQSDVASLKEPVNGIAIDPRGWLWIATSNHVLRVSRRGLLDNKIDGLGVREYGLADGLRSLDTMKRHRSVIADAAGRIWFSFNRSLSVVDPSRALGPSPPAIVHMQEVSADGRSMSPSGMVRLPSPRQRVTFSFTGLSLAVPDRIRFRYRLDGFDGDWSAPTSAREAVYTNLGPGPYTFRVMASNSDGLWNGSEAVVQLEIGRVFWQTPWFRTAAAASLALIVLGLYRLRVHQMTSQLNVRFEERLAERTRIAQELHDTLLQGFLSASMQLHVATDTLPENSPARPGLTRVAALMKQVIDEGRNAVRGLRSTDPGPYDLEQAFSNVQQELGLVSTAGFRVIVEGQPRPLNPLVRDEVYRIGREALVNAFRHARASTVEVELEYAARHMRMLVRDDGVGIEPEVLKSGSDGHWGLSGMRERAERIGARFKVFSRAAAGTEVELWIPSHIAWGSSHRPR